MQRSRFALAPALAVALLSVSASPASAAPAAADRAAAKQLTADAEKAMGDKRWMDAVSAYRKAAKIDPGPARDLALAQALAAAGKLLDARKVLAPLAEGTDNAGPARKAREAAKKALADVSARLAGVKVTITGAPDGKAKTLIDGIEVASADEIPLNPGSHTIGASAEGSEDTEKEVRFAEGAHLTVELSLTSKAPPAAETAAAEVAKDKPHGSRAPGALLIALGSGGLIMGSIFRVMANQSGSATPRAVAEGTSVGQASTLAFIVGGALAVSGIVVTIVAPGPPVADDPPSKSARLTPWVGPGGVGAGVTGTF